MPSNDEILRRVADYYAAKLAAHGATARGVDWNDDASHALRHQQFLSLVERDRAASIIDLGCGYGDFLRFLRDRGFAGRYIGYDIAPEMIAAARRLHGEGENREWRVGANPNEIADYAIANGILNVKGDVPAEAWSGYVRDTIDVLAQAGRRGFGFNVLSLASDPERRRPDLYYADAAETRAYCTQRFDAEITLLQDYGLYEFTILARKN